MTNAARAVFGPAVVYALTSAASAAVPVLILPIMTRVLSPEEYGLVGMFSVVVTICGALAGLSVHGAVGAKYFQPERYDLPRYITTCLAILAASTAAAALVVWPGGALLERITKIPAAWLLAAVLVAGCQLVVQIRLVVWQSAGQPWRYGALRVGQALTDAALSLVLVLALTLGWQGRTGGMALAIVVTAGVALITLHQGGWLGRIDRAYARDALKFGVPLIPHAMGWMLLVMVDRFMISNLIDVHSTGLYMVALQIGMVLGILIESYNKSYSAWVMKRLAANERGHARLASLSFLAMAAAAVVLGLSAPWFLPYVVGPQFVEAGPIVIYVALGHAFSGMYSLVANPIFFGGRTAGLGLLTFGVGVLNVALSYWLLLRNGVIGAGQAFMLSQALLFLGTWWLARLYSRTP